MIGNDIVDLDYALENSRWRERRFLEKVFSATEQAYIFSGTAPFLKVWRLWSMKESAYKIYNRTTGDTNFNPRAFHCYIINQIKGKVGTGETWLNTETKMTSSYINTTAFMNGGGKTDVFEINTSSIIQQRTQTYQNTIKTFADWRKKPVEEISIIKNSFGIPEIFCNGTLQPENLSLSHHGRFASCAFTSA